MRKFTTWAVRTTSFLKELQDVEKEVAYNTSNQENSTKPNNMNLFVDSCDLLNESYKLVYGRTMSLNIFNQIWRTVPYNSAG